MDKPLTLAEASQLINEDDYLLLDWDGCLSLGNHLAEGALDLLRAHAGRAAIVSNQSAVRGQYIRQRLLRAGVDFSDRPVLLAGELAIDYVRDAFPNARVYLIATSPMRALAAERGLNLVVDEQADVVLALRNPNLKLGELAKPIRAVRDGAHLVAANPDHTHPLPGGGVAIETGAIAELIGRTGQAPHITYIGKPMPPMYKAALRMLKCDRSDAVAIGDNKLTDGAGADAMGIRFLWVRADRSSQRKILHWRPR